MAGGRRIRARRSPWPLLLLGLTVCATITPTEVDCEEAVARLARCCPGFAASSVSCVDDSDEFGCAQPDLQRSDARCVLETACGDLEAHGVCQRAIDRFSGGAWSATVCR